MRHYSKTLLVSFLAIIGGFHGVQGQTKINLGGASGESTCALRDRLNGGSCGVTRRKEISLPSANTLQRRAGEFTPVPSACTCNTPFFNIWSACELFESRSRTLPLLKDWRINCSSVSITLRKEVENRFIGGIEIPEWAYTKGPTDDATFDVAGIVLATTPRPWSLVQIIAPIASALATLLFLSTIYLCCIRQGSNVSLSRLFNRPHLPHFPRSSRVQSEEPKNDWVIDKDRSDEATPFPTTFHRPSTSSLKDRIAVTPQPLFQPNRPVHHVQLPLGRRPRSGSEASAHETSEDVAGEGPVTSRWSDSQHQAPTSAPNRGSVWARFGSRPQKMSNFVPNVLKSIPSPFKARPVRVKPVVPRAGFRLDDYDTTTDSMSKVTNRMRSNSSSSDRPGSAASSLMRAAGEDKGEDEDQQERLTLISREERTENEVFLISKNGSNFSLSDMRATPTGSRSMWTSDEVNSSIGVVSPTASTLASSWGTIGNSHAPPVPQLPPPRLPPPPKAPPPRLRPAASYDHYPLAHIVDDHAPSRERAGLSSASNSPKILPVTVSQTNGQTARPNLLHPPLRSVYEPGRYPSAASLHQRSLSQTGPDHVQAHLGVPHRRGLSEDDTASFYLCNPESMTGLPKPESAMHSRMGSRENLNSRQSDPQMLFPPSVRSAGYFGAP